MVVKVGHCALLALALSGGASAIVTARKQSACRNQPGNPGFPSEAQWKKLKADVGGRLVAVVPSAEFCQALPCTEAQWESTTFRSTIPGAMNAYNWEQDYLSTPPSLCLRNATTCGQGNVPLFAVNASSAADIQAGVKFASKYNLRVAIKSSGHDFLGRSTAKNSLLLWTRNLRKISFTDHFLVGKTDHGSAVTVGSGTPQNMIYAASKAQNKIVVGGNAATVAAAGGYVQGAGYSPFSPTLGLAADTVLEFQIVTADGKLVTANAVTHSDLFWALRGGGAGSWGVVISATFSTFPIFNATLHVAQIASPSQQSTELMSMHARHIFDWDDFRAGQFFFLIAGSPANVLILQTYFPNLTADKATAAMKPLLDEARAMNFTILAEQATTATANDLVFSADENAVVLGASFASGSRLIPAEAYQTDPDGIGRGYTQLLDLGIPAIFGDLVAGGKVSDNVVIDNAVIPKWRRAKTQLVVSLPWNETTPVDTVELIKQTITTQAVPILADMTLESDSGAYSNEANVLEPNPQVTFFGGGTHYQRLLSVKKKYDPTGLFIVAAGVGSEHWDAAGLCLV